jgi:hypothetical protein
MLFNSTPKDFNYGLILFVVQLAQEKTSVFPSAELTPLHLVYLRFFGAADIITDLAALICFLHPHLL